MPMHTFFFTEQCTDTARLRENVLMPIVFIGIELISLCLYKWILIYTYVVYSIQKKKSYSKKK